MLVVNLARVEREGRARVDAEIPPDDAFWKDLDVEPSAPLTVRLEAQQAGPDVVVRGALHGVFGMACRRCLDRVETEIDEELGVLYRAGVEEDDEGGDVLPLPERGNELDLTGPVREQVLLAVPRYVYCREDCKGLCATCGANLNETTCECAPEELDERWAPLRQLKQDT